MFKKWKINNAIWMYAKVLKSTIESCSIINRAKILVYAQKLRADYSIQDISQLM